MLNEWLNSSYKNSNFFIHRQMLSLRETLKLLLNHYRIVIHTLLSMETYLLKLSLELSQRHKTSWASQQHTTETKNIERNLNN